MLPLSGKRILYIGVSTFNYEKEITSALQSLGAEVDFFDDRPSNDFLTKTVIRLNLSKLLRYRILKYYASLINATKGISYDYVFIIKGESIDLKILEMIKSAHENSKYIFYMWDSLENNKGKEVLFPYFDRAITFDRKDSEKEACLEFLPLFYIPLYSERSEETKQENDLCFIGTGHTDRYFLVKEIERQASKVGLSTYSFFYLQSKLMYFWKAFTQKNMRGSKIEEFSFESLSQNEVSIKISQSKVIVDIEHKSQSGLTMRTIEMLGCEKKLITTNSDVKNYDFYREGNIYIIDRDAPIIDPIFFEVPYVKLDDSLYKKYSINNWLISIFS